MCKYYASLAILLVLFTSCIQEESLISNQVVVQRRNAKPISIQYTDANANVQSVTCERAKITYGGSLLCNVVLYNDTDSIIFQSNAISIEPIYGKLNAFIYDTEIQAILSTSTVVFLEPSQTTISAIINGINVNGLQIIVEETDGF